jgi:CRP-like cAMP-binding protein
MTRTTENKLLASLSDFDRALLEPHLINVDLKSGQRLQSTNSAIRHVYFPEVGLASVVIRGKPYNQAEVAVVGNEGMIGIGLLLGARRSRHDVIVQMPGCAHRCAATQFLEAVQTSESLPTILLRYVHVYLVQCSETALANGAGTIEQRLCRWLLMATDRVDGPLALTHELLGVILSVRRAGVTIALRRLANLGLVATHRGMIAVHDRNGLIAHANGLYGAPQAEFEQLLGARDLSGSADQHDKAKREQSVPSSVQRASRPPL